MFSRTNDKCFLKGFISGIIVCLIFLVGGFLWINVRGITIYLNNDEVTDAISEQIIKEMKKQIPAILDRVNEEVPRAVKGQMTEILTSNYMEIAGFRFKLPDEFISQLEETLQCKVTMIILQIIENMLVKEFDDDIYMFVKNTLGKELNERIITVKSLKYISFPIQIMVK